MFFSLCRPQQSDGQMNKQEKNSQLRSSLCLPNVFVSESKVETTASTTEIGQKKCSRQAGACYLLENTELICFIFLVT